MKNIPVANCCLLIIGLPACSQNRHIGGGCEGCEAIYENTTPFDQLKELVWLPDWKEDSTRLAVNGVVYKADGKTPAPGVILYIYHTDQTGVYPNRGDEKRWGRRNRLENRGGSGILVIPTYFRDKQLQKAERNIYLGKNIPDYPTS